MAKLTPTDEIVIRIEQEKHEIRRELERLDVDRDAAMTALAAVEAKSHAAWDAVEKSIPRKHHGNLDMAKPEAVKAAQVCEKRAETATVHMNTLDKQRVRLRAQLRTISDPSEVQRRLEQQAHLQGLRDRKKEDKMSTTDSTTSTSTKTAPQKQAKQTAKDQGFPDVYLGPTGNFVPGADSTAKHDLIVAYLGLTEDVRHKFTKQQAEKLLKARGWMPFVEKRQASIEADKARAAKRERAKAEAAAKAKTDAKTETDAKTDAKAA